MLGKVVSRNRVHELLDVCKALGLLVSVVTKSSDEMMASVTQRSVGQREVRPIRAKVGRAYTPPLLEQLSQRILLEQNPRPRYAMCARPVARERAAGVSKLRLVVAHCFHTSRRHA